MDINTMVSRFWFSPELIDPGDWNTHPEQSFIVPFLTLQQYAQMATNRLVQPDDQSLFMPLRDYSSPFVQKMKELKVSYPSEADLILVPRKFIAQKELRTAIIDYLQNYPNKKILLYCNDDYSFQIPHVVAPDLISQPNIRFYHTSFETRQHPRRHNEYAVPCFRQMPFRDVKETPIALEVGFCGSPFTHEVRYQILTSMREYTSKKLPLHFVLRNRFHAHQNIQDKVAYANEYVNHMYSTVYALCVRGSGNFSYRFCEAMMAGRIPIVLDTGGVLPFDHLQECNNAYTNKKNVIVIPNVDLVNDKQDLCMTIEKTVCDHFDMYRDTMHTIMQENQDIGVKWFNPQGVVLEALS